MSTRPYFVRVALSDSGKMARTLAGPFATYAAAAPALREVNAFISRPPFAYIRRAPDALTVTRWTQELLKS